MNENKIERIGDRIAMIACIMIMLGLVLAGCTGCKTVDWVTDTYNDIRHHDSDDSRTSSPPDESGGSSFTSIPLDVTQSLTVRRVNSHGITFSASERPKSRYATKQDGGTINGSCFIYDKDGNGGRFDDIRPRQQSRDFKNVHDNYVRGFKLPAKGETVWFFISDIHKQRRTPISTGVVE